MCLGTGKVLGSVLLLEESFEVSYYWYIAWKCLITGRVFGSVSLLVEFLEVSY